MAYIGKVESGSGIDMTTLKICNTWVFDIYWKRESDGGLELVTRVCSCEQGSAKLKARCQAKLDDYVKRYADYAKSRGVRYEIQRREKKEAKKARELAKAKADHAARVARCFDTTEGLTALRARLSEYKNYSISIVQDAVKAL